jgi:hypothetical protein
MFAMKIIFSSTHIILLNKYMCDVKIKSENGKDCQTRAYFCSLLKKNGGWFKMYVILHINTYGKIINISLYFKYIREEIYPILADVHRHN